MKEDKCEDKSFIGYVISESWASDFGIGIKQGIAHTMKTTTEA